MSAGLQDFEQLPVARGGFGTVQHITRTSEGRSSVLTMGTANVGFEEKRSKLTDVPLHARPRGALPEEPEYADSRGDETVSLADASRRALKQWMEENPF